MKANRCFRIVTFLLHFHRIPSKELCFDILISYRYIIACECECNFNETNTYFRSKNWLDLIFFSPLTSKDAAAPELIDNGLYKFGEKRYISNTTPAKPCIAFSDLLSFRQQRCDMRTLTRISVMGF